MALNDSERERTRYHLGYLSVGTAAALSFGEPRPIQTLFLVDLAMDRLLVASEDRVRRILGVMDGIEEKLIAAQDRLAADKLDELVLRKTEPEELETEYVRWGGRLADILGAPFYHYSTRYKGRSGGVFAGSIPVRN